MRPTLLQTKYAHKRLTSITVNGNTYPIDNDCCVVMENEADMKKLLSLGDEWSAKVSLGIRAKPSRAPQPGKSMRSAAEFIELASQDPEISAKMDTFRSFRALASFAEGLGFRFTENEFQVAGTAFEEARKRSAEINAENEAKMKASEEEKKAKKGKKGDEKKSKKINDDEDLPEVLPEEESGEWPEPADSHSLAYLRRMADAYEVQYDDSTDKAELIVSINTAMFSDS